MLAFRLTVLGRGPTWVLFPLCVLFVAATTIFLNLDTTAILLTPVLLATARRARMTALPLAMKFCAEQPVPVLMTGNETKTSASSAH